MSSPRDTLPADPQHAAFGVQYDLDGDVLTADDHAATMENLSIASDAETSDNPIPVHVVSHVDTSSEEQTSARDELEALFAGADGSEAVTDVEVTMENTLTVLEKAYANAEKKVEVLCRQAAQLYVRRTLIEVWPEPKRSHGLKVADDVVIAGRGQEFIQHVDSMQVEHEQVSQAKTGDSVGMKVDQAVKEGDLVYLKG